MSKYDVAQPNSVELPQTPSILILTDPYVDVKGRFGKGKRLGWLKEKCGIEGEKIKVKEQEEKDKKDKGEAWIAKKEDKAQRKIMSIPLSSDRALSQLREESVVPVTTIEEIKQIAQQYSEQFGIPIAISPTMGSNQYTDAVAYLDSGRVKINLHPLLQYRDREYIEARIMQEIEDCRDFQRTRAFGWQRG